MEEGTEDRRWKIGDGRWGSGPQVTVAFGRLPQASAAFHRLPQASVRLLEKAAAKTEGLIIFQEA